MADDSVMFKKHNCLQFTERSRLFFCAEQVTVTAPSLNPSCQLEQTRRGVIVGCVNASSSHYNTYLTCLSATRLGLIYLQLSPQISHFPRCFLWTHCRGENEDPDDDLHVVLPGATILWAPLTKTPPLHCLETLTHTKKERHHFKPQIVAWLQIFAHADIGLALPSCTSASLQLSTLDLMNSPLVCLLGPSDGGAPSCCKTALIEEFFGFFFFWHRFWLRNFRLTSFPKLLPEVQWLGFQLSGLSSFEMEQFTRCGWSNDLAFQACIPVQIMKAF